jgi:PST family polysaccharide transporter
MSSTVRWRLAGNAGWLLADRLVRGSLNLAMAIWLARHLGPETFGLYGWALAFASLATICSGMGFEVVAVRELVRRPADAPTILGTMTRLRLVSASVGVLLCAGCAMALRSGEPAAWLVVLVAAAAALPAAADSAEAWFQAGQRLAPVAVARSAATLLATLLRAACILGQAPLVLIVAVAVIEAGLAAAGLYAQHRRSQTTPWRWDAAEARTLAALALPQLGSGLAITLAMRQDHVLLAQLVDDRAVGVYAAAVRLTELWYLLPLIACSALFPALVQIHRDDPPRFAWRLRQLYAGFAWGAILLAVGLGLAAPALVALAYGPGYQETAGALQVLAWCCVPVFVGVVSERYLVITGDVRATLLRSLAMMTVNGLAGWLLIPRLGPVGAAWAALIGQTASVLCLGLWPAHRHQLAVIVLAVLLPWKLLRRPA